MHVDTLKENSAANDEPWERMGLYTGFRPGRIEYQPRPLLPALRLTALFAA